MKFQDVQLQKDNHTIELEEFKEKNATLEDEVKNMRVNWRNKCTTTTIL